jgi:hypothetical protein
MEKAELSWTDKRLSEQGGAGIYACGTTTEDTWALAPEVNNRLL